MRLFNQLQFDHEERHVLRRVHPCVLIAFPDARVWPKQQGRKQRGSGTELLAVCSRSSDRFSSEFIHAAWDQAVTLSAVLQQQSHREYWERELAPKQMAMPVALANKIGVAPKTGAGVSLIAPDTDVCGMLAEIRARMYKDTLDAVDLLARAVKAVGPLPEREED